MSSKRKDPPTPEEELPAAEQETEKPAEAEKAAEKQPEPEKAEKAKKDEKADKAEKPAEPSAESLLKAEKDRYLRPLAEYDNYRKRSAKERESIYQDVRADTVTKFLPVYDNLERALKQETCDEAYAKGVQMTMTQLKTVLEKLGVEEIPAQGQPFDPNLHNAVMHMEDEAFGENIVAEVFLAGFKLREKVIRHALVKVAN